MSTDLVKKLRTAGIQPSAQRLAVAQYVLTTDAHPSADEVLEQVHEGFPMLSRATVYNTLNLFVEKGLLRQLVLQGARRLPPLQSAIVGQLTGKPPAWTRLAAGPAALTR